MYICSCQSHCVQHIHLLKFMQDTLCMSPASDFYKKLALDCSSQQIGVDLFAFGGQFMDLTTICKLTTLTHQAKLFNTECRKVVSKVT